MTKPPEDKDKPQTTGADITPVISVIVPTFYRPDGALAAVRSIFAQVGAPDFEVILVDNDAEGSARGAADRLAEEAHVSFHYLVEPMAGVANARNRAVGAAKGRFIACLDDDEVATPNWLAQLIAAQAQTGADVVFGPIEARLPDGAAEPKAYFQRFFSRLLDGETRLIDKPYGCGNALLVRETVLIGPAPFDPGTNETGGEDDLLWAQVRARGGTYGWAKDAWVYEDVPLPRASWAYLTKRAFAFGHNTSALWFEAEQPDHLQGVLSMARGVLQAVVMGLVMLILFAVRHERRIWAFEKMMVGLGKVFWFGPFQMRLYGAFAQNKIKAKTGGASG